MKIVGVAFFVKIFAFQSVILHQSPLLLNSQTNYRKNLLCSVVCLRLNRLITSIIFLLSMMRITNGCITDSTRPTKQLNLSVTSTQQETGTISTTDTDTSTLGSYYNSTVASLTDDCGVGAYSVATGKAVAYGIVGGLWGATEGFFYGLFSGDALEDLVIGSMVGSGLAVAVGVKDAYDDFKSDTSECA